MTTFDIEGTIRRELEAHPKNSAPYIALAWFTVCNATKDISDDSNPPFPEWQSPERQAAFRAAYQAALPTARAAYQTALELGAERDLALEELFSIHAHNA